MWFLLVVLTLYSLKVRSDEFNSWFHLLIPLFKILNGIKVMIISSSYTQDWQ